MPQCSENLNVSKTNILSTLLIYLNFFCQELKYSSSRMQLTTYAPDHSATIILLTGKCQLI